MDQGAAQPTLPEAQPQDDYDLSMARLDPGVALNDHRQAMAVVRGWFRKAGLSPMEAKLLVDRFNAAIDPYSRPAGETDRLSQEALDYLQARWGADYQANMAQVDAAIARLGGDALEHFLRASGLRFDPFVLRTLADVGRRQAGLRGGAEPATEPAERGWGETR